MYDLSDDRNCKETGIFAGAFAAGSFLCDDRIWNQHCLYAEKESQHQSILISCPLEQVHCWDFQELLRCMRQRCFYCSNNVM